MYEGQSIQRGIAILRVCIPLTASFPLIGSDNFEADVIHMLNLETGMAVFAWVYYVKRPHLKFKIQSKPSLTFQHHSL
jgi:hypothetical protein